jgi:hypothetical protein
MYFQESEAIAHKHPDLLRVIEQVDQQLAGICSPAPLRPTDFACALGANENQVISVFELLARQGALITEEMLECRRCRNLMSANAFRKAIDDEDEFACSSCSQVFSKFSNPILVYRLATKVLTRFSALIPAAVEPTLGRSSAVKQATPNTFRYSGDMWILSFDGRAVPLKDSVGLVYIARLLSEPNRDIAAVSLLAARAGIDPRIAKGSAGPILTEEARRNYERRYLESQEDLADAKKNNDLGRLTVLENEMDALMTELARATGLSGRRREKTDADRVRKSVSMAVSRAIERIAGEHETLGRHLEVSISSGRTFRYSQEHPVPWLT